MVAVLSWPTSSSLVCSCASRTTRLRHVLDDVRLHIRRTALALLGCFGVVALALGYWQGVRASQLGDDPANPRVAQARLSDPRGRILDRNGEVLAMSEDTPDGTRR